MQSYHNENENPYLTIIQPTKQSWIKYIFLFLLLNAGIFLLSDIPPIFYLVGFLLVLIVPGIYTKLTKILLKKNIQTTIRYWKMNKFQEFSEQNKKLKAEIEVNKVLTKLIGFNISKTRLYYLEGFEKTLDLNNIGKIFSERIFNMISGCIGITFIIGSFVKYIITITHSSVNAILLIFIVLSFSPLLIFWLIPLIWTLKDAEVKSVDEDHNIWNLGTELSKGIFSKLLGFAGLFIGLGFLVDITPEIIPNVSEDNISLIYITAALLLLLFIFMMAGTSSFITIRYLSKYHLENVELCRKITHEYLEVANTEIHFKSNTT